VQPAPAPPAIEVEQQLQAVNTDIVQLLSGLQQGVPAGGKLTVFTMKVMRVASDPKVAEAANAISTHPHLKFVVWIQLGFLILMILLKSWRQSLARNWFNRMMIGLAFTLLITVGISFVIPLVIFRMPYIVIWKAIFAVFFGG
jgi:hypothetical protein